MSIEVVKEIVYLDPAELTPWERNAKRHGPDDIEGIKKSIIAVGFDDPIGIWGDKNIIVEGHGRWYAAMEMGLDRVPCVRLDHMTDTQRREYAIRHNRTQELSSWDFEKLEEELAALMIAGIDMEDLNFKLDKLAKEDPNEGFKEFTDSTGKTHVCPRCGHEWTGEGNSDEE